MTAQTKIHVVLVRQELLKLATVGIMARRNTSHVAAGMRIFHSRPYRMRPAQLFLGMAVNARLIDRLDTLLVNAFVVRAVAGKALPLLDQGVLNFLRQTILGFMTHQTTGSVWLLLADGKINGRQAQDNKKKQRQKKDLLHGCSF